MIRILGMVLICTVLTGCVTTTKMVIRQHVPEHHLNYEISQEWTRTF